MILLANASGWRLIGTVKVIEDGKHIIGEIDPGRLLTLCAAAGCSFGAQERT